MSSAVDAIINLLRAGMPPLLKPEQIGLCLPDNSDKYLLGAFVYAVTRDPKTVSGGSVRVDSSMTAKNPLCAELRVVITSYVGKKSGLADDYKLLERVMQIWHDRSELPVDTPFQPSHIVRPRMELLNLDADEISKIWQFSSAPYTLSLFYKLAPVVITSGGQHITAPVGSIGFNGGGE